MPSLGDAYGTSRWGDRSPHQILAGIAVLVAGAIAIFTAICLVTTPLSDVFGLDEMASYRVAGLLAGPAVSATLLGVVAVLPASSRQRIGVVVGSAISLVGVALYWYAYPAHWTASEQSLAFPTAAVYFLGSCLAVGFVFSALASSHVRNNPTGKVRLKLTREGESRVVELSQEDYQRYARAVSDGGEDSRVIREIESKYGK